ncbi:hypothetical protein B0H13DRAFT_2265350 [Mycena leptocephala]|nr:hypothetical protein B0H13DRAFT_2265350 [Mycena leptocephala]
MSFWFVLTWILWGCARCVLARCAHRWCTGRAPRNYPVILGLFTREPRENCAPCMASASGARAVYRPHTRLRDCCGRRQQLATALGLLWRAPIRHGCTTAQRAYVVYTPLYKRVRFDGCPIAARANVFATGRRRGGRTMQVGHRSFNQFNSRFLLPVKNFIRRNENT